MRYSKLNLKSHENPESKHTLRKSFTEIYLFVITEMSKMY